MIDQASGGMEPIVEPIGSDTTPATPNEAARFPPLQLSGSHALDDLPLPMPHPVSCYAARWSFSAWCGMVPRAMFHDIRLVLLLTGPAQQDGLVVPKVRVIKPYGCQPLLPYPSGGTR